MWGTEWALKVVWCPHLLTAADVGHRHRGGTHKLGQVYEEVAGGVAATDGLENVDGDGFTQCCFPDCCVGGTSAVTVDVLGLAGAIFCGGAEASVGVDGAVADVNLVIALAPDFEVGLVGLD